MLTERQHKCLDAIKDFMAEKNFPPTVREIGHLIGVKNPNGVVCHLSALANKGFISRTGNSSRSIVLSRSAERTGRYVNDPDAIDWEERFWKSVQKRSPEFCWLWSGLRNNKGYGFFRSPTGQLAHRAAWVIANGPIPEGQLVCHRCDNPPCVNPDHLFLGTYLDNNRDSHNKGRAHWQKVSIINFQI